MKNQNHNDSSPEMDPALWGGLPPSLFSQIFARLPTKSVVRFRSVSKKYNMLPLHLHFAHLYQSLAPPTLMLITHISQAGRDLLHCIHENGGRHVFQWDFLRLSSVFRRLQLTPRASASGFLCFSLSEEKIKSDLNVYYICNPITREWRTFRLPSQMADPLIVGMYLDAQTSSCKVIVGADRSGSQQPCEAFVYDGLDSSWKQIAPLPNRYVKATPPVLIGRHLYWLVEEPNVWGSGQWWAIGFDSHEEIWTDPISISKEFVPLCLGECNGEIVLVTMGEARGAAATERDLAFQVWNLDKILKWAWEHTINIKIEVVNAPTGCDYFFRPSAGVVSHGVMWLTENRVHTVLKHDLRQQSSPSPTFLQNVSSRFPDKMQFCPLGFEPTFRHLEDCRASVNGK